MGHMWGLLAVVPLTMLLTVSFFVLFARQKTEDAGLKTFGLVVAVCLWVAAAIVLGGGLFTLVCGGYSCCGKAGMEKMRMYKHGWGGPCMGAPGQTMMPGASQSGATMPPEPKKEEKKK